LNKEMILQGTDVRVVTTDTDRTQRLPVVTDRWTEHQGVPVFYGRRWGWSGHFSPSFIRALVRSAHQADLLHVTAVYGWWLPVAAGACWRNAIPLVLSPRGSFAPEALAWHSRKKRVFESLGGTVALRAVEAFHATAPQEEMHIRTLFPTVHVGCVPNGVDVPDTATLCALRQVPSEPYLLFLGRLHTHKNLDLLLRAWAPVARDHKTLAFYLVGPDDERIGEQLGRLATDLGLERRIHLLGRRDGQEKSALLARARVLVLPSKSENFGNAVAEALAHGTPVITTTGTPWSEASLRGCGWWVDASEVALGGALREAVELPRERLAEMGARGRAWMQEAFSWPAIATRMRALYAEVIERTRSARTS